MIKKIVRALSVDTLKKYMAEIYQNFKKMYNGTYVLEALDHVKLINHTLII